MMEIETPLLQASAIALRLMERGLLPDVTRAALDIHVGTTKECPGPDFWQRNGHPQLVLSNSVTEVSLSDAECEYARNHSGAVGLLLCVLDASRELMGKTKTRGG